MFKANVGSANESKRIREEIYLLFPFLFIYFIFIFSFALSFILSITLVLRSSVIAQILVI